MIKRMSDGVDGKPELRSLPNARDTVQGFDFVLLVDGSHGSVQSGERSLYVPDDFCFGCY
jgi:hypothetical protein